MRDRWAQVTLGEIASITIGRTPPRNDSRYWTTSLERPFCTIADLTSHTVPTREGVTDLAEKEGKARRAPQGSLLFSFKLTIGRVGFAGVDLFPNEAIAIINPLADEIDKRYLGLALEMQDWATAGARAVKGNTLNRQSLEAIPIPLPPLSEQRRIVDIVASIDHSISRLTTAIHAAWKARVGVMSECFMDVDGGDLSIEDLLEVSIGGVWGEEPGSSEVDVRVYRSTEFDAGGRLSIEGGVMRSITHRQLDSRRLREGDILLEKSGGGPNQPVGRVMYVSRAPDPAVCANFVQLLRPDPEKVLPEYLWNLLWWWHFIGRTEKFQRRTTGIRNLQTRAYLAQRIKLPPRKDQVSVVELLASVESEICAAESIKQRLLNLRETVVTELLSGSRRVPSSYDRFLEDAS